MSDSTIKYRDCAIDYYEIDSRIVTFPDGSTSIVMNIEHAKKVIDAKLKFLESLENKMATPEPSLLNHIYTKIQEVQAATKSVCVLQFAIHPEGLAMILRCYQASVDKEHCFTDVILAYEAGNNEKEIKRIDILFDEIHKALKSVQIIKDCAIFH
jgi:hypothetical protein